MPKTRLIDPAKAARYGSRMQQFAWDDLPDDLKPYFDPKSPVHVLTKRVTVYWGGYEWCIERGFYWDGASIPLALRIFGVSRFTHGLELYPGSLFHDAGVRGELPRLVKSGKKYSKRTSRWAYDQMYHDLGIVSGYPPWRMRWQQRILNMVTWTAGEPPLEPLPALVAVKVAEPEELEYLLDWRRQ